MAPILSTVIDELTTTIDGLTDDTYNYNWGQTNTESLALVNWDRYDACALILWESEENLDGESAHANAYYNKSLWTIRVRVPLEEDAVNPNYEIQKRWFLALDDLKQAFADYNIGDGYYFNYQGCSRVDKGSSDIYMPHELDTQWSLEYTQDRDDPEQAGDA